MLIDFPNSLHYPVMQHSYIYIIFSIPLNFDFLGYSVIHYTPDVYTLQAIHIAK